MKRFPRAAAMILAAAVAATALISLPKVESQPSCVSKLAHCFATLNTTTKPSKLCCDSAKEAFEKEMMCLCTIYSTPGLLAQFNVTTTQALNLSTRCDVHTDLARCYAFGPKASLPPPGKSSRRLILILGASAALTIIIIIVIVVVVKARKARRKKARRTGVVLSPYLFLRRYSYANVKRMTNKLSHVIGEGGFGIVYKGKLPDSDRYVAVKILRNSKGNREDVSNEILSMSKVSHDNIVSLHGYCLEGDKIALIYEFMPNGSLNQFIRSSKLAWETLCEIALGVARGLEYLHNGCGRRRIVHFDIKPENILMDENFRPKIADFGLAKLCKGKESIMSILGTGGTFGFMAPEVFSNDGRVSYKADIYSLGKVILEMMRLRNRDIAADSGSSNGSTYFPYWIYEDLETGETMRMFGDQITEEVKIAKKMVLVALWCIQDNPSDRPKTIKVIEMLEGDIENITIPPNLPPVYLR